MKKKLVLRKKLFIDTKIRYNFFFYYFVINFRKQIKFFYYLNLKFFNFLNILNNWNFFFFYFKAYKLFYINTVFLPKNYKKAFVISNDSLVKLNKFFFDFFRLYHIFGNFFFTNEISSFNKKNFKINFLNNKYFTWDFDFYYYFNFFFFLNNRFNYNFLNFLYINNNFNNLIYIYIYISLIQKHQVLGIGVL